jgi:hypothetical protein
MHHATWCHRANTSIVPIVREALEIQSKLREIRAKRRNVDVKDEASSLRSKHWFRAPAVCVCVRKRLILACTVNSVSPGQKKTFRVTLGSASVGKSGENYRSEPKSSGKNKNSDSIDMTSPRKASDRYFSLSGEF